MGERQSIVTPPLSLCIFENVRNVRRPQREAAYSVIGLVNSNSDSMNGCILRHISNATVSTFPQERPNVSSRYPADGTVNAIVKKIFYNNIVEYEDRIAYF